MGKSVLREDKTCLNCRYVVENKFCPNCGQENTESRKTFHHLFIHFFEDLTHYENAFWKTIKNLLFKPATLTKEYLSGKRLSYLAPVRLYIFISFITFFFITLLPPPATELSTEKKVTELGKEDKVKTESTQAIVFRDTLQLKSNSSSQNNQSEKIKNQKANSLFNYKYNTVRELDSIQKFGKAEEKASPFEYWFLRKGLTVAENNTTEQILEKGKESFIHNFSKVLFIYMPIFAFFLWLFHNKKRWYYFDHGIFTLHYFSFLLLIFLILFLVTRGLSSISDSSIITIINTVLKVIGYSWMIYYFFPAHHRFYGETRLVSFIKSILLFFLNFVIVSVILTLFAVYTFINLQ